MVTQQDDGAVGSDTRPTDTITAGNQHRSHSVSNAIQFIQLNLQQRQAASALLSKQIARLSMAVVAIQERWINQGRILGLNSKGCSIFHGCGDNSPHTCIVTKRIRAMCLPQFSDRDITFISMSYTVNKQDRTVIVVFVYMAIKDDPLLIICLLL